MGRLHHVKTFKLQPVLLRTINRHKLPPPWKHPLFATTYHIPHPQLHVSPNLISVYFLTSSNPYTVLNCSRHRPTPTLFSLALVIVQPLHCSYSLSSSSNPYTVLTRSRHRPTPTLFLLALVNPTATLFSLNLNIIKPLHCSLSSIQPLHCSGKHWLINQFGLLLFALRPGLSMFCTIFTF